MRNEGLTPIELARLIVASAAWLGRSRGASHSRGRAELSDAVDELRDTIAALPPLDEPALATETGDAWHRHRLELRRKITNHDPATFLIWNPIVRSMTLGLSPTIRAELRTLRESDQWTSRWMDALRENRAGLPMPRSLSPFTSGTLIHHAYHVHRFETATGRPIVAFDKIVEFGGGYGSMARLIARLGFRGRYHIHDLPEFCALQRFYLQSLLAEIGDTGEQELTDALSRVTISSRREDASPSPPVVGAGGLFLATWSLSEAPLGVREEWGPTLGRFQSFLFGFQDRFAGMDNRAWFEELASSRPDVEWVKEEIPHRSGGFYLFGLPAS